MARAAVYEQYGEPAYVSGIRVYTTITRAHQEAANAGLRLGVLEYDRRHGYRGPEAYATLPAAAGPELDEAVEDALQDRETVGDLVPAVVLEAKPGEVSAVGRRGDTVKVTGDGLKFAARALTERNPDRAIRRGAVIRLQPGEKGAWSIAQVPRVEASLVSLDPRNGSIGASRARASSRSSTRRRWRRDSRPRPC